MTESTKIAFIGAGNMANALIGGMLAEGFSAGSIFAADPHQPSLDTLQQRYAIKTLDSNTAAAAEADVLVLAVKPQVLQQAISELAPALANRSPLVISVVAGIAIASIRDWLGKAVPIVRCMPNTPALVRLGATALFGNELVDNAERELASNILSAVGITAWVDNESDLDVVTAVSGSGPAYFFALMEAMQEKAVGLGLSDDMARQFVQQTALGAAQMALTSDVDVAELRRRVSSPGGTTLAALAQFERGDLNGLVAHALDAARNRAVELADELGA